jgi:hypothetical protein
MKYIITESQHKLISELERTWRDSEYTEQYERLKPKMVRYFENLVDSHSENDLRLNLFDSDLNAVMVYNKPSGDLYYNRNFDDIYGTAFPHPIWLVHGKFIMSDVFNEFFPDYEVKSVRSITLS